MPKKINYQGLEKKLTIRRKSCWEVWDDKTKQAAFNFAEGYKKFIDQAKSESETVTASVSLAKGLGFKDIATVKIVKPGELIYSINRDKSVFFARLGKKSLLDGVRLVISHIDSPHLDFKVTPLYEDENLAFLKTHYYGGIKKYQWPTIALALHGIVYLDDGKKIDIKIGEKDNDPVFMITDLLPHLERKGVAGSQEKTKEVQAEELNLLIGSLPVKDEKIKEKVKLAILEYLFNHYGIKEENLASAELKAVPSEKARDLGFDRSLISAYGQDDRACAYPALMSLFGSKLSETTQICAFVDREEIGSEGNTGARSTFIETFILDLLKLSNGDPSLVQVYRLFGKSKAISADVTAAVDPDYKDVFDLRNACRLGFGLAIEKYTGSGGKYSTSDAPAKLIQEMLKLLKKDKKIVYQLAGGLGKADVGGGGTVAKYMANRNMDIIDAGIALFNMHAPLEISSKADIYCAYLSYKAFYEN